MVPRRGRWTSFYAASLVGGARNCSGRRAAEKRSSVARGSWEQGVCGEEATCNGAVVSRRALGGTKALGTRFVAYGTALAVAFLDLCPFAGGQTNGFRRQKMGRRLRRGSGCRRQNEKSSSCSAQDRYSGERVVA